MSDIADIVKKLDSLKLTDPDTIKQFFKDTFDRKLRGKRFDKKKTHCGSEGMWVESQFKASSDNNTHADLYGYEIKKQSDKITFGDWSADEYIFAQKDMLKNFNGNIQIGKNEFIKLFGRLNIKKKRYSWSGSVCPTKCNVWTNSGQLLVTNSSNDIFIIYSNERDNRRGIEMPSIFISKEFVILAYWKYDSIDSKVNKKFNNIGTAIMKKDKLGVYTGIQFCSQIKTFHFFQELKSGIIFFDSGMYEGNSRNYSQFRAHKTFWNSITIEEY